jgi:hypothetical protein
MATACGYIATATTTPLLAGLSRGTAIGTEHGLLLELLLAASKPSRLLGLY